MTTMDQMGFRETLKAKQGELSHNSQGLNRIAIERSADTLEEAQYKADRELAIAYLNRESEARRNIEMALLRIQDGAFGTCLHCGDEISRRRLQAVPWAPLCIRCQEAADLGGEEGSLLENIEPSFSDAA